MSVSQRIEIPGKANHKKSYAEAVESLQLSENPIPQYIPVAGPQGPQGPQGARGSEGPKGDKGERGQDATPLASGSFATTGSNVFIGNQLITGSLSVSNGINPFFIINSNGYVGLNTSTPTTQLDVVGNAYITGGLALGYGANTGEDLFIIKSGSFPALRVNNQGLLILGAFSILPSAQEGAVAYSASGDFFLGF